MDVVPRQRRLAIRGADDAAHPGAPAVWQEHQVDRRIQLRRSGIGTEGRVHHGAARSVLLDEHGLRSWREVDGRVREDRVLHRYSRFRKWWTRGRIAGAHFL